MLRKLMKEEILASYRTYVPILLAIIGMTLMSVLGFRVEEGEVVGILSLSVTMLIMGAAGGFTLYNLVVSLGTRVYGKPGYLLFSVPAKTWEIMVSKLLVNLMWIVLTLMICAGSVIYSFSVFAEMGIADLTLMLEEIFQGLGTWDFVRMGVITIISVIYQIVFFMFLFALLNLIYKGEKKVLIGILLFFGLNQVVGVLQNAVIGNYYLEVLENPESVDLMRIYWGNALLEVALALLFFFLSYHFMDKKMELQ